jgi:hypothetical protein
VLRMGRSWRRKTNFVICSNAHKTRKSWRPFGGEGGESFPVEQCAEVLFVYSQIRRIACHLQVLFYQHRQMIVH